jgi:hypothetical protein
MRERDYILATNLAKLRMAELIIRETLPGNDRGLLIAQHQRLMRELRAAVERSERFCNGKEKSQ